MPHLRLTCPCRAGMLHQYALVQAVDGRRFVDVDGGDLIPLSPVRRRAQNGLGRQTLTVQPQAWAGLGAPLRAQASASRSGRLREWHISGGLPCAHGLVAAGSAVVSASASARRGSLVRACPVRLSSGAGSPSCATPAYLRSVPSRLAQHRPAAAYTPACAHLLCALTASRLAFTTRLAQLSLPLLLARLTSPADSLLAATRSPSRHHRHPPPHSSSFACPLCLTSPG